MFTENEIAGLIAEPKISELTVELKKAFIEKEAPFLELSDHDFLYLTMLTPTIGIALANGNVSLIEEMTLNKKARKLSKGGYWMKRDPVVTAMGHLIDHFDDWEDRFLDHLKYIMELTFDKQDLMDSKIDQEGCSDEDFCMEILQAPFVFIRFLSSFFQNDEEEDFISDRKISRDEYEVMESMARRMELDDVPIFKKFMTKLHIK